MLHQHEHGVIIAQTRRGARASRGLPTSFADGNGSIQGSVETTGPPRVPWGHPKALEPVADGAVLQSRRSPIEKTDGRARVTLNGSTPGDY